MRTEELEKKLIVDSLIHLASTSGLRIGTGEMQRDLPIPKYPPAGTSLEIPYESPPWNWVKCHGCDRRVHPAKPERSLLLEDGIWYAIVDGKPFCPLCLRIRGLI
jgi:hypothetical protein